MLEYSILSNTITVIFNASKVSYNLLKIQNEPLNEPLNSIITNLIKNKPNITINEMVNTANLSKSTIKRIIKQLVDDGNIVREGSKKAGHWIVK